MWFESLPIEQGSEGKTARRRSPDQDARYGGMRPARGQKWAGERPNGKAGRGRRLPLAENGRVGGKATESGKTADKMGIERKNRQEKLALIRKVGEN